MKVQVVYSSLSGNTKRLAYGIYNNLKTKDKSIHDLKDGIEKLDGDIILLGYWVDNGDVNSQMKEFMSTIENKVVGVFATLAFYADSKHGMNSIVNSAELLKDKNKILGNYVCNGSLSQTLLDYYRKAPAESSISATPQNEIRWGIMKDHPTQCEIDLASERFNERIEIYQKFIEQDLEFKSIL